jgi:ketosteroid isomerase-like protein
MSRENVEVVQRGFAAVMDADRQAALEHLHPEVELYDFDIPDAGAYRGHDGFFEWLKRWGESWETWRVEDLEVRAGDRDQVIALFRMIARGGGSGIEVERLDAIVYRLKGAKIVRIEYFNDQEKALEAAGLSE